MPGRGRSANRNSEAKVRIDLNCLKGERQKSSNRTKTKCNFSLISTKFALHDYIYTTASLKVDTLIRRNSCSVLQFCCGFVAGIERTAADNAVTIHHMKTFPIGTLKTQICYGTSHYHHCLAHHYL